MAQYISAAYTLRSSDDGVVELRRLGDLIDSILTDIAGPNVLPCGIGGFKFLDVNLSLNPIVVSSLGGDYHEALGNLGHRENPYAYPPNYRTPEFSKFTLFPFVTTPDVFEDFLEPGDRNARPVIEATDTGEPWMIRANDHLGSTGVKRIVDQFIERIWGTSVYTSANVSYDANHRVDLCLYWFISLQYTPPLEPMFRQSGVFLQSIGIACRDTS